MPPTDRGLARVSAALMAQVAVASQHDRELSAGQLASWQPSKGRPIPLADYLDRRGPLPPPPRIRESALPPQTVLAGWQAAPPASLSDGVTSVRVADAVRVVLLDLVHGELTTLTRLEPAAQNEAARALATIIADRFGGKTLEVRIPPVTAVQLRAWDSGPQHSRGTPPNVIEMDAATWVRLGMGADTWAQVRPQVSASGAHVDDIAAMLPIYPAAPHTHS